MLCDLVTTGDTEVYASVSDEGGDIGCGKEDEGDIKVLDEGNVKAGFATELDVAAGEELDCSLL